MRLNERKETSSRKQASKHLKQKNVAPYLVDVDAPGASENNLDI